MFITKLSDRLERLPGYVYVFILLLLSLFMFLFYNLREEPGINEAVTLGVLKLDAPDILHSLHRAGLDTQPPFYYFLLKGVSIFTGSDNIFILRSLSALCAGMFLVCFFSFVKKLFHIKTALITTFLLLWNPLLISYARDISLYPFTLLITTIHLFSLYFLINKYFYSKESGIIKNINVYWFLYLLTGIIGLYTHYFFLTIFFIHLVYLLYLLIVKKDNMKKLRTIILVLGIMNTLFVCSYIPWIPRAVRHLEYINTTLQWEHITILIIFKILGFPFTTQYGYDVNAVPFYVVVIFFIIIMYFSFTIIRRKKADGGTLFILFSFIVPFIFLFFFSLFFSTTFFIPWFFIFFPFFFLFLLLNILRLKPDFLKAGLLLFIMAIYFFTIFFVYTRTTNGSTDELFSYMREMNETGNKPVFCFDKNLALVADVSGDEIPEQFYYIKENPEDSILPVASIKIKIKTITRGEFPVLLQGLSCFRVVFSHRPVWDVEELFDQIISNNFIIDNRNPPREFISHYSWASFKLYTFRKARK